MSISCNPYQELLNFKYFYEISKIPRMSFHEEKIADYLEQFAQEHGFWYHRDDIGNVIMKKPGTDRKEDAEPIILQAHTDMVCEKEPGSGHNFLTDPIEVYVEDSWMKARGTTLGADDGAGVANILGLLSEPNLNHPPLECVFTVQEENGMGGAKSLDYSLLNARRMIGLDGIKEGTTIFSASAVYGGKIKKDVVSVEKADAKWFTLTVGGLASGHGALNIGNEQANAIKVAARILYHLNKNYGIILCSIKGGNSVHVIPRDCTAVFEVTKAAPADSILNSIREFSEQIALEYKQTDPYMEISGELVANVEGTRMVKNCSDEILGLLYLLPVGAAKRNSTYLDRVEGSWNLSIIDMQDNQLVLDVICRANHPVTTDELKDMVTLYAEVFKAKYEETFSYSGHHVPEDSPLTQIWEMVYKKHTGQALEKTYMHSALDAGTIYNGLNEIDLIVVMPTVLDVHTPQERMNVDSFARTYQYLKDILEY